VAKGVPFMTILQKMDTKTRALLRFTTVTAHYHRGVFVESENNIFSSEDPIQCFNRILLRVGTAVHAPPLP
jgi:hypothetical protein